MKFTSAEAIAYSKDNRIAEWANLFLTESKFLPNFDMAGQLRERPTFWRGPVMYPLRNLNRVCGPEPGMSFPETVEIWNQKVGALLDLLDQGIEFPPLFVKVRNSKHFVADGAHRLEALLRRNKEQYWTLWYAHEEKELGSVEWQS